MPRNTSKKEPEIEDLDDDGEAGRFLDGLPEVDDDDDDDNDKDDDDDLGGEPEMVGAPVGTTATAEVVSPASPAGVVPVRRGGRKPAAEAELHVSTRPRGIRGPRGMTDEQRERSPALRSAREFQDSAYAEIDTLLASLNFATREYEVRVERLEPDFDENDVPCRGQLATYRSKVTVDDIQRRFGGGTYQVRIFGPHPTTARPGIIKQEKFTIAGPPKPMKSERNRESTDKPDNAAEALRVFAESSERMQMRVVSALEKQQSAPNIVESILPVITPLIEKFMSKADADRQMMLDAQREERRRDEERRREEREERNRLEERRREEDRKAEEKRREEERARREEERERRDEERRAEDKRREEERERRQEERERQKEEREKERERAREDAAERQRQHDREMATALERTKQDQQRQTEYLQMMQDFSARNMEMLEKRQESGGLKAVTDQLLALKALQGQLTGSDEEQSNFEKFNEGVQNIATTVMPLATQLIGAVRGGKGQQTTQVTAQVQPPIGKPIVVDLGPARPALPNPSTPPPTQPAQPTQQPAQPAQPVQAEAPADPVNDVTTLTFPTEADDLLSAGTLLMKNLDLAVQKNMTAEQVVKEILEPFDAKAPMLMSMASGMSKEEIIDFLSQNAPASWALMSPRGEELISESFEMWTAEGE